MENIHPNAGKKEEANTREQVIKYFTETDDIKLEFSTPEEAKQKADEINQEYGDIAFVVEDRGGFAVKFKASHVGEGFEDYFKDKGENGFDIAA